MAVFRKISSPKSWLICIVVLFVVLVLSLLIKFHSVVNSCLVPESTYFYRNQIPDRGKGQGRNISSQSMSSHLKIVSNAAPLYTDDNVTAAKFWERIDSMITNDNLYSEDFNVSMVVNVLRHAKLVKADLFLVRNSYKWILYIQGGQRVVFKPWLVNTTTYRRETCLWGCEHPEYEIAGFTINRLLGFRNFPFTTGRILSWTQEVLPVATGRLKHEMKIKQDGDVCLRSRYSFEHNPSIRCFKNGNIPGAMIYFLNRTIYFRREEGRDQHHEFDLNSKLFRHYVHNLPGDNAYCSIFRNLSAYRQPRDFGDFLDAAVISYITDHRDQKITVIRDKSISLNVMFDFGLATRKATYERLKELATSLPSRFTEYTRDDPLYPLLQPEQILKVAKRIRMLLSLTSYCIEMKGYQDVARDFL